MDRQPTWLFTIVAVIVVAVLSSGIVWWKFKPSEARQGSVAQSNEYHSTSTSYLAGTLTPLIKTGFGTFGSVVITGANTGAITFYDATTTSRLLRAATMSTSSIILGTIVTSQVAGTYTFDTFFVNGLIADIIGLAPTSTITWR
jgi:hypothetical protein